MASSSHHTHRQSGHHRRDSSVSSQNLRHHQKPAEPVPMNVPTTTTINGQYATQTSIDHHYSTTVAALLPEGRAQLMKLCWCNFGTALSIPQEIPFEIYTIPHDPLYRVHVACFSSKQLDSLPPEHPMRVPNTSALALFANAPSSLSSTLARPPPEMIFGACFISRLDEAAMDTTQVQQLFHTL